MTVSDFQWDNDMSLSDVVWKIVSYCPLVHEIANKAGIIPETTNETQKPVPRGEL